MKVWVLTEGEDYEGGHVDSVYAERELAAGRFMEMAEDLANSRDEEWQTRAGHLDRAADLLSEAARILDDALVKDGES